MAFFIRLSVVLSIRLQMVLSTRPYNGPFYPTLTALFYKEIERINKIIQDCNKVIDLNEYQNTYILLVSTSRMISIFMIFVQNTFKFEEGFTAAPNRIFINKMAMVWP